MIYSEFIDLIEHDFQQKKAKCPFDEIHNDTHASLFLSEEDGWFCFGCNNGGGPRDFIKDYLEVSETMASYIETYYNTHGTLPLPTLEEVEQYHQELLTQKAVLQYLNAYDVDMELVKKYKIGWDKDRLIFPIYSRRNPDIIINLRKYMPPGQARTDKTPKIIQLAHLGNPTYYPFEAFEEDEIVIVEGEKDMLISRSHGINSVTSTGGTVIPKNLLHLFENKKVYVAVDNDQAGDKLALQYQELLNGLAKEVLRIKLPEKDYSDSWEKDRRLDIFTYVDDFNTEEEEVEEVVNISEVYIPENANKEFRVSNMRVVGEHMHEYQIPKSFTVSVDGRKQKIDVDIRSMVGFMNSGDAVQEKFIKSKVDGDVIEIIETEEVNLQRVYFKEDISSFNTLDESGRDTMTGIYFYKREPLKTNRVYDMKILKTTEPKTQITVFAILDANECIMDMKIDPMDLENFRTDTPIDILLDEYYNIWQPHLEVTGRKDLFTVMLVTYLSVLEFNWRNSTIKGWLDSIIIGDTRTGKTKMIRNFMKTLKLGEYVSGENAKGTGIIGGIQQIGSSWSLNWGKIPINDKRLVIIDEASGLSIEDITMLSQMRSEGILSITKIKSETTYARTRLLWITNPRSGEKINHYYWRGYEALNEFLPVQEDLARFDLACSAAVDDVENIHEYVDREPMTDEEINLWRQLVLFAWSLDKDDIEFTSEAVQLIIESSNELGDFFNGSPIFLKANGYEKIARVSISLAILTFNYIDDKIVVEERHVEEARNLILSLYNKESFGLGAKALQHNENKEKAVSDKEFINNLFNSYENLDILFRDGTMSVNMVGTILGIDNSEANRVVAQLYGMGLVRVSGRDSIVKPTPAMLEYIREKTQ